MKRMVTEVTSVSTKGQIVLPKTIRDELSITPGTKLVIMCDGDNILIKPIKTPTLDEFSNLLDESQKWAKRVGLQEEDINDAVKSVRKNRKEK